MTAESFPYWRLSAYYFFYFAFLGGFTPYFGLYLQSLSFSAWDIGLLMSQMQLMRVFGPYLWGRLADRSGQRLRIVRLTSMMTLLAFASFFLIRGFAAFLAALAVLSLFWVASLPLAETLTFDHLRDNPTGYSRVRVWGSVGFIVTVAGIGALLDHLGLAILLTANFCLIVGLVASAFLIPEAGQLAVPAASAPIGAILRQRRVMALLAACFAMAAAHAALNIFYAIFLSGHGYSTSMIGGLFTLGVLAEIAVFFYMSALMRRFSLRAILLACFAAGTLRFALIGYGVNSLVVLLVAQLLHGLTFGALHAAAIAAVNRWFSGTARARGQALYSSISFGAGGLVGGLVSGWSWNHWGGATTFALSSLFALAGLLIVGLGVREAPAGNRMA